MKAVSDISPDGHGELAVAHLAEPQTWPSIGTL